MNNISIEKAKHFKNTVKDALLKDWDPIGVGSFPEAQDEYDAYVPELCSLLISKKSAQDIFKFLWELETGHMGLNGDRKMTEMFAKKLTDLTLPESQA
jgi:hypothetical protein